jgi:long-chain fatty acid transport protein
MTRIVRWSCVLLVMAIPAKLWAQGALMSSFGPVNASMGGASTAAPIEAMSALGWNPASISGLPNSELGVGLGLLLSDPVLSSSVPGWSSGTTGAEPGTTPIPNFGWVHKVNESTTIGLGALSVAGFKTNYPADPTNPVLAPVSNTPGVPGGLGSLYSEAQFLEIVPVVSYAVTDRMSIGFGPTITTGQVVADPLLLAAPNDTDASGIPRYPAGRGTRYSWGGGAQLGVYYVTDDFWHFGASIKSPQWMEEHRVLTECEMGLPLVAKFKLDLPMIVSVGTAYSGFENLVLALDLRYIDCANTDGVGDSGYSPYGALNGLSWTNQFVVATGAQYRLTDRFLVRGGYVFNTSPYGSYDTFYNVASSLGYQHQLCLGGTWEVTQCVAFHVSYQHYFEWESTGPIVTPAGVVPGSSVTATASAHIAELGVTVKY